MNRSKKIMAGIASVAMLAGVASVYANPADKASAEEPVIFSADFEDDECGFTRRGEAETLEVTDAAAHGGSKSLCVSTRAESWNGAQIALDGLIEAGQQYLVTAYAKTEWYSTLTLSMQYDNADGETQYGNVLSMSNEGSDWSAYENVKFSFPPGSTNMHLYFEASDALTKIYIDDFTISNLPDVEIEDLTPLRSYYTDAFKIGTALTPSDLASKPFMKLVDKHFSGSITVGNELKPDYVLNKKSSLAYYEETGDDTNPQVSLAAARSVLDYCLENNIPVRGHTLVWHSQTPDWFFKEGYADDGEWVSKEKMTQRMENYIKNVMETLEKEYPDLNIYAWDVVNEAWEDNGSPRQAGSNNVQSGQSAWVKVYGDNSFIDYAFKFARKYAPEGTLLYYNDYNEYIDGKTNAIIEMAERLKEQGLIDGIGMQSHLDVGFPSAAQYKNALKKFAATGLDIQVTELDITTADTNAAGFEKQAQVYSDIFDAIYEYKDSISAVIFWGVTDDASWRANQTPLIFDSEYKAKPAFYSIIDGLEPTDPPVTTPSVTTAPAETTPQETTPLETTTPSETTAPSETTPVETTEPDSKGSYGDLNSDGVVDLSDLSLLSLHLLKEETLSDDILKYADVDGNESINLSDLARMRQYISKRIDSLGPKK
ncbi:MAG: glycoside hydrolase [Ruminococcus sp.]|nr:glycoside hydrolase [Ruminococcus sp.]